MSRSVIPHSDPPDFKPYKQTRYNMIHDHPLWFKDAAEQQYIVTLKFNQYRGLYGLFLLMVRYVFIGIFAPFLVIFYLKRKAHHSDDYYGAYMAVVPGHPFYEKENTNILKMQSNYRNLILENKNKDFLGRRN